MFNDWIVLVKHNSSANSKDLELNLNPLQKRNNALAFSAPSSMAVNGKAQLTHLQQSQVTFHAPKFILSTNN